MGTQGRSWLKHLLFGSMAEEVVRLAHCPLMIVKAPTVKAAPPVAYALGSPGTTNAEDHNAR